METFELWVVCIQIGLHLVLLAMLSRILYLLFKEYFSERKYKKEKERERELRLKDYKPGIATGHTVTTICGCSNGWRNK